MSTTTISSVHGFSITLSGGGTYKIKNVAPRKRTTGIINAPHHGLAAGAFIPKLAADLTDAGGFTVTVLFEGTVGLPAERSTHTVTVNHPLAAGESTAAKEAGTAIIHDIEYPGGEAGAAELKVGSFMVTWDGNTGPALTLAGAASSSSP